MTSPRPSSAMDFRRQSTARESETGGVGLRLNPNRARTPRSTSVVSYLSESEPQSPSSPNETNLDQVQLNSHDSEKTPLIGKESSNSKVESGMSGFSHTVSQEISGVDKSSDSLTGLRDIFHLEPSKRNRKLFHTIKVSILIAITVMCCGVIMVCEEEEPLQKVTLLPAGETLFLLSENRDASRPNLRLQVSGPFYSHLEVNVTGPVVTFDMSPNYSHNVTINMTALAVGDIESFTEEFECLSGSVCNLTARSDVQIPLSWNHKWLSWQLDNEVIYAFLVLGFVYIMIIFELVHRTLAALLGALAALAVLSALNQRPSLEVIISWIDMDTLTLLFGMMIIVAIFSETGFFDYSALQAYKLAKGKIWPLVTLLCVFSAVVSAFLDNVTTILLMAPVTIRLCEVLNLEPRRILIAEVLFSNIGGTATAIGDPPNVIIVGALGSQGITFTTFTMHVAPGIVLICFVGYGLLRLYYRNMDELKNKDPPDISEMKQEISMWRLTASRLQTVTREETLMKALFLQKAVEMEHVMYKTLHRMRREEQHDMIQTLRKLERQYYIKDFPLLLKSGFVLCVVVVFLFIYSFVEQIHLDIGWIAVLGALWLLVLADNDDMEGILHRVEWSTLLFFAALFVLMEALSELGMIKTIGDGIADMVKSVDSSDRLVLAVVAILWISAIASSFIDNIPYTTAMVPVLQQLSENPDLDLPLLPLVVALAFGACLGGNGTLIGASCNVVCAGIAEQHGYGFSFVEFFKVGFPMMLVTTAAATVYILLCHVAMDWNYV
ncbi:P protein [Aplysia californica]|uniref:P protein n=1 Tax=Aplysia californica TaxID=6500 RepID=A0ABM1A4Z0_APLCA|nr:P protein [Aplysia californica]